jgi:hypothetical protein
LKPGNANLPIGVANKIANQEIGVPRRIPLLDFYVFPQLVRPDVRRIDSPFVIRHDS